jgi:hypothetical protein
MSPSELVGWVLNSTTAITAITSTRINHGLRPTGTAVPSINYFQMPGATWRYGIEVATFSVNCRAQDPETARDLGRLVVTTFNGTSGTGMYGTETVTSGNSFDVARSSLRADQGLVPEPTDGIYNAPVDIQVAYATNTVS